MPARPGEDRASLYRRLPLWVQWGLPFGIAIAVVVVVVVFVNAQSGKYGSEDSIGRKALITEAKQGDVLMNQEQQPHNARLAAGLTPAKGLEHAITVWFDNQTRRGLMNGPVQSSRCVPAPSAPASSASRQALKCVITAANVRYDFEGVVQPARHQVTYCQKIEYSPQVGVPTIPLSPACI